MGFLNRLSAQFSRNPAFAQQLQGMQGMGPMSDQEMGMMRQRAPMPPLNPGGGIGGGMLPQGAPSTPGMGPMSQADMSRWIRPPQMPGGMGSGMGPMTDQEMALLRGAVPGLGLNFSPYARR